ncbi:MAG: carboxylate--amine ligase [Phycisphaerae bacterium]|nr:carboxylate--amine ligase [Phycisphaerae bacterium]
MTTLPTILGRPIDRVNTRQRSKKLGSFEHLVLRIRASLGRLMRWEFWPSWVLYALLVPHILCLMIRHRSATIFTAANPRIPLGGLVGESKWQILNRLPVHAIVPTAVVESGNVQARCAALAMVMQARGWSFPLVLKPDVGERGSGVRLVQSAQAAQTYFEEQPERVLAQIYHPGPFEAGVFYVRHPAKKRGRIFSITDKVPPIVIGDGESNLETLIWRHPRYRLQARVFLNRLGPEARRVPRLGEPVRLALAGNHCQGTMFRDGDRLLTPALARAIDDIVQAAPGFCFGRFDIRYECADDFRAGRGFRIVELNGVLSESTNVYDPAFGLLRALRVLMRQWTLAFEIGSENHAQGASKATLPEVLRAVIKHRARRVNQLSD